MTASINHSSRYSTLQPICRSMHAKYISKLISSAQRILSTCLLGLCSGLPRILFRPGDMRKGLAGVPSFLSKSSPVNNVAGLR